VCDVAAGPRTRWVHVSSDGTQAEFCVVTREWLWRSCWWWYSQRGSSQSSANTCIIRPKHCSRGQHTTSSCWTAACTSTTSCATFSSIRSTLCMYHMHITKVLFFLIYHCVFKFVKVHSCDYLVTEKHITVFVLLILVFGIWNFDILIVVLHSFLN